MIKNKFIKNKFPFLFKRQPLPVLTQQEDPDTQLIIDLYIKYIEDPDSKMEYKFTLYSTTHIINKVSFYCSDDMTTHHLFFQGAKFVINNQTAIKLLKLSDEKISDYSKKKEHDDRERAISMAKSFLGRSESVVQLDR